MQNHRILFCGNNDDIKLSDKLCSMCKEQVEITASALVGSIPDNQKITQNVDCVVCEHGTKSDVDYNGRVITYSVGQSDADLCALNFQKRETTRSLELLCGSFMGRVNMPLDSPYSEKSVLLCAAALYGSGVPMPDVLKAINECISIKER